MFSFLKKAHFLDTIVLFTLITFFIQACAPEKTEITATFDHGSIGAVKIIGDTLIKGQTMHWIKKDKIGNQYYWFHFKLSNVMGKTITFEFDNMTGMYRGELQEKFRNHTQPVFSYDRENWSRITNVSYNKEIKQYQFLQSFEKKEVWIAYAHPYPIARHSAFIENLKLDKTVQIEKLGESVLGNDITLVTIPRLDNNSENPINILILACQHAGEDCGGYFVEGLVKELLLDSEEIREIRKYTTYKIIPMMNPDGMYYGMSRYNYNMEDLNSEWDDDVSDLLNMPVEPEVKAVKDWYYEFKNNNRLNLVVDVHSYGQDPRKSALHSEDNRILLLMEAINNYWPVSFIFKKSQGNCRGFFVNVEKIPACTLELSQSDFNDGRPYLTIEDYHEHGGKMVYAMDAFISQLQN